MAGAGPNLRHPRTARYRSLAPCALLLAAGLVVSSADPAQRSSPVLIGALTESWGPTPHMVGLRDGLQELGYRENEQFFIDVPVRVLVRKS